jgi:hypothetical protein
LFIFTHSSWFWVYFSDCIKVAIEYRFLRRFDCLEAFELVILQAKNAFSNKVLKVFILRVCFKKKKCLGFFFFKYTILKAKL